MNNVEKKYRIPILPIRGKKTFYVLQGVFVNYPDEKEHIYELEMFENLKDAQENASNYDKHSRVFKRGFAYYKILKRTTVDELIERIDL